MIKIVINDTEATQEEHEKLCRGLTKMDEGDYLKEFMEQDGVEVYIQNHGSMARLKKKVSGLSSIFKLFSRKGRVRVAKDV